MNSAMPPRPVEETPAADSEFDLKIVGQIANLRPIGNRPPRVRAESESQRFQIYFRRPHLAKTKTL
jgi:hypothetical protein